MLIGSRRIFFGDISDLFVVFCHRDPHHIVPFRYIIRPAISWLSSWSSSYWLDHEWFTPGSCRCYPLDVWSPPNLVLVCCLLCWLHVYSPSNFFVHVLIDAGLSCMFSESLRFKSTCFADQITLCRLCYSDSVVNETCRLASGVFMIRYVNEDTHFKTSDGKVHLMRANDRVAIYPPAIHKDPEIYKDPLVGVERLAERSYQKQYKVRLLLLCYYTNLVPNPMTIF